MNMEQLPAELATNFERRLDGASVPTSKRPEYINGSDSTSTFVKNSTTHQPHLPRWGLFSSNPAVAFYRLISR